MGHVQILYDGDDTDVVAHLRELRCVTLMFVGPPFASALEVQEFWAFEDLHWQWGGQPGNYNLMVKQGFGVRFRTFVTFHLTMMLHSRPSVGEHFNYPC